MKRAIVNQYNQLEEKYTGIVNLMNYRFLNMCVKAEEGALLPVKVQIDGQTLNLEDVATMAKKNDYEFVIMPNYTDDLLQVGKGITMVHPEFKQTVDKLEVEVYDANQQKVKRYLPYILLTMPEVDDERYDLLKQLVGASYDECKVRMDAAKAKTTKDLAPLLVDEMDADQIREFFNKLNEDWEGKREGLYKEKMDEIEKAYIKWLGDQGQQEIAKMNEEDALGKDVCTSMKIKYNN